MAKTMQNKNNLILTQNIISKTKNLATITLLRWVPEVLSLCGRTALQASKSVRLEANPATKKYCSERTSGSQVSQSVTYKTSSSCPSSAQ